MYNHKRTTGKEMKTLCGKRYNHQQLNIMFYWINVLIVEMQNCNEEEATHSLHGIKCCYECMYNEINDNLREDAIESYIDNNGHELGSFSEVKK